MTSLAPGTQWSHSPIAREPAERALFTYGAVTETAPAAAAVFRNLRRDGPATVMAIPSLPDERP